VIAMLRLDVGTDYRMYVAIVSQMGEISGLDYVINGFRGIEPATYLVSVLSGAIGGAPLYFFIFSAVTIIFLYLGIMRLKPPHKYLLYFVILLILIPMSFNGVRQAAAISILFYATVRLIDTRRYGHFLIISLVAAAFHISAIVFVLIAGVYKFLTYKKSRRSLRHLVVVYLVMLLSIGGLAVLFNSYGQYIPILDKYTANNAALEQASNRMSYVYIFIFMILVARYRSINASYKYAPYLYTMAALGLIFTLVGFISEYLKRFALFFVPYNYILLVYLSYTANSSRFRKLLFMALLGYGLLYFVGIYFILGHSEVDVYTFIFTQ